MGKRRFSKKVGLPPGKLVYTGDKRGKSEISLIDYDAEKYEEINIKDIEDTLSFKDSPTVTWINITGLHNIDTFEKLKTCYNIHPLVLEDILNVNQRPKIEYFENYIFIVLKMIRYDHKIQSVESNQISIISGEHFIFTILEEKSNIFDPIKERIQNAKGIIRKNKVDYLLYALIDIIVDHYFVVLEEMGEAIETLEDKVVFNPSPDTVHLIHRLKRNLIELRRSIWPLREILNALSRGDSSLIHRKTLMYFKDVYDHAVQVIETIEEFRDTVSGILDIYLSSVSNRMNEIMKILTIMATIFIPLTFIAGIYGMNFKYMPELNWRFGYSLVLIVMVIIAVGMIVYFRKKRWL